MFYDQVYRIRNVSLSLHLLWNAYDVNRSEHIRKLIYDDYNQSIRKMPHEMEMNILTFRKIKAKRFAIYKCFKYIQSTIYRMSWKIHADLKFHCVKLYWFSMMMTKYFTFERINRADNIFIDCASMKWQTHDRIKMKWQIMENAFEWKTHGINVEEKNNYQRILHHSQNN